MEMNVTTQKSMLNLGMIYYFNKSIFQPGREAGRSEGAEECGPAV